MIKLTVRKDDGNIYVIGMAEPWDAKDSTDAEKIANIHCGYVDDEPQIVEIISEEQV